MPARERPAPPGWTRWRNCARRWSAFGDADSIAVEEFVEGHEGFYDTIAIDGHVAHDWITHYYPNVLEAMRHRWISPQFITTNRIDDSPFYGEVREMGARVIEALGIGTSATHMEWFYGPKGLRFSEIGCRPPGVGAWDLYSAANDDRRLPRVGARDRARPGRGSAVAAVLGRHRRPAARTRTAGSSGYSGVDEIQQRHGQWIIDAHLPDPGTGTQPVEAGYMANAWVRMRHPDYDTLRGMLDDVGRTIKVYAGERLPRGARADEDGPARAPTVPHHGRGGDPYGRARGHGRHGDRRLAGPRERHRRARCRAWRVAAGTSTSTAG